MAAVAVSAMAFAELLALLAFRPLSTRLLRRSTRAGLPAWATGGGLLLLGGIGIAVGAVLILTTLVTLRSTWASSVGLALVVAGLSVVLFTAYWTVFTASERRRARRDL